MAKKMTLDETWKNCLSMWRWIAKQKRAGSRKDVFDLKEEWLDNKGRLGLIETCFFCDYNVRRGGTIGINKCKKCPAKKVDSEFHCEYDAMENDVAYKWNDKPIAFYNKLVSLNRKRLKAK